jgi:hypothetical protein
VSVDVEHTRRGPLATAAGTIRESPSRLRGQISRHRDFELIEQHPATTNASARGHEREHTVGDALGRSLTPSRVGHG